MKLKTLKDMGFVRKDVNIRVINEPELKAEAVKWVKHFQNNIKETDDFELKTVNHGSVMVLKDFFNITEDDLERAKA